MRRRHETPLPRPRDATADERLSVDAGRGRSRLDGKLFLDVFGQSER
jgi:hypothetical protein